MSSILSVEFKLCQGQRDTTVVKVRGQGCLLSLDPPFSTNTAVFSSIGYIVSV